MMALRFSPLIAFVVLLTLQTVAYAQTPVAPIAHFGAETTAMSALPKTFRLLDWNIHKGGDQGFAQDLAAIATGMDLVFFQEAVENPELVNNITQAQPQLHWSMVRSFYNTKDGKYAGYTGVAIGSRVTAVNEMPLFSPVKEPVVNTPKTALVSEYRIEGSDQTLLVVDVHMINFTMMDAFTKHLQQIVSKVQAHVGPMLIAGDFNTWSDNRVIALKKALESLQLQHVSIDNYYAQPFIYPYDHVFVRGMKVTFTQTLTSIHSSDHMPVILEAEIQ